MFQLLLAAIYVAFISLGLPDALLGAAWPVLHQDMGVPLSCAGIVTFIISCGTICSSLASDWVTRKLGTGKVTAYSVLVTAVALFGFSCSSRFWMLCFCAIPYGLGAGAVDAALNNYVALHYSSRHMNWVHCCWAVGVTISPSIMGYCFSRQLSWQWGYRSVALLQILLTIVLFATLGLWRTRKNQPKVSKPDGIGILAALKLPGVKAVLLGFFCYCALESTAIVWVCTYLAISRGFEPSLGARCGALFFCGIMGGRFLSGFIANRLGDRTMIRIGARFLFLGSALLLIQTFNRFTPCAGLLLMGIGCAPIYPAVIHSTPKNFGEENSQVVIGLQMACAYLGSSLTPPLFGLLAEEYLRSFPLFIMGFGVLMLCAFKMLNRIVKSKSGVSC